MIQVSLPVYLAGDQEKQSESLADAFGSYIHFPACQYCSHIVSELKRAKVWTTQTPTHTYDIDFTTRQHECLPGGAAALWYHAVRLDKPFHYHWKQVCSMQLKHDNRCPHTLHYSNLQTLKPIYFVPNEEAIVSVWCESLVFTAGLAAYFMTGHIY